MLRERDIEAHLVRRVKDLGGECRKIKWIGRRGAPDRLVMLPECRVPYGSGDGWRLARAELIFVELKAPGKKAEPHQLREHKRMQAMGQRVVVIDSIEAIEELLS